MFVVISADRSATRQVEESGSSVVDLGVHLKYNVCTLDMLCAGDVRASLQDLLGPPSGGQAIFNTNNPSIDSSYNKVTLLDIYELWGRGGGGRVTVRVFAHYQQRSR